VKIIVLVKMVPDVVEELEVAEDGKSLDLEFLRLIMNERDDHALEEALILKERAGGSVTAVALEAPEIDDVLFTALAKGADRAVKITGVEGTASTRASASLVAAALSSGPDLIPADLILAGCQAADDLDGQMAPLVAHKLDMPYLGIVTNVQSDTPEQRIIATREYPGGVHGQFEVEMPAVLGIQAAEKPPRYVPVAKVRAAMKSLEIETVSAPAEPDASLVEVAQMTKPESAGHAEMIEGSAEDIATKIEEILGSRGLV
jgi:electron transfer flavoprotein beta subunit